MPRVDGQEPPVLSGRLLGLDVGDRRIGVAVSDPTGLLATPLEVYNRESGPEDVLHLLELARGHGTDAIVVGLPINMNGSEGEQAQKTRQFAESLEVQGLKIRLWDERLSTVEAARRMSEQVRRKKGPQRRIDAEVAAVILQSYLEYGRRRGLGD